MHLLPVDHDGTFPVDIQTWKRSSTGQHAVTQAKVIRLTQTFHYYRRIALILGDPVNILRANLL